ncbi:hypothetical protein CAter282_1750 [Collimonas arenae]|uniref:Uncharacterized protein n=1 Tax=Collimonas arenae TaxID=279058 RepID=A0A127PPA2_9BURK|nr:hypothetical protein CAter10_1885 [Collimonas arenae]AMP09528.1 hypothetical protein CAter282_1750 [Collimonas arenae]
MTLAVQRYRMVIGKENWVGQSADCRGQRRRSGYACAEIVTQ